MTVQFDRAKFLDTVHYVVAQCPSDQLGGVKLHKVLYFADMLHFAFEGRPLTGATYRKRRLGPTADYLLPALRQLKADGRINVSDAQYFGYRKWHFESLRAPDESRLNDADKALLGEVIEFVCKNNTAKTISDFSHNRAWELAAFGQPIPYHSAFHMFPSEVSDDAFEWAEQEMKRIEAAGPEQPDVAGRSFSAFRARVLKERGEHPG